MKKLPPSPSPSIFSVPDSDQGGSQSDDDYREPSSSPDPVHRRSSIKRKRGSVSATTANAGAMTSQLKSTKTKKSETITSNKTGARRGQSQSGANKTLTDRTKVENDALVVDIEDSAVGPSTSIQRAHGIDYHFVDRIGMAQEDLLSWFEVVRSMRPLSSRWLQASIYNTSPYITSILTHKLEKRGMPWRKRYDPSLSMEEKGQRAYEIWVSEVMLQQTQVNTVIAYWKRWIEKWPTIADLAKADVEEVNAMWRGLGYYRRARSLLAGAKTVMANKKFKGRLPEDPAVLEKEVDGVGRYTAGAISSMAYGVRTPIVDGNIHRLLTRLLALHAPQTAPATIKFLWTAAADLVGQLPIDDDREGIAGDWNQALMELGSQVCKPVSPDCAACPLQPACNAYSELSARPTTTGSESNSRAECTLCAPIPLTTASDLIPSVQVFPMKKEKKASREEEESVLVLEWRGSGHDEGQEGTRKWLYVKRPEKGLLAGLYEPPTTPVNIINSATASASVKSQQYLEASLSALKVYIDLSSQDIATIIEQARYIGSIPHIFSHINMKYHIIHSVLSAPTAASDSSTGNGNGHQLPEILDTAPRMAVWLDAHEVEHANVGTGVKKVWSEVYGSWGSFEPTTGGISANANDGGIRKRKTGASGGGGSGKEAVGARAKTKTLEKNSLSADGDGLVSDHSGSRKVVRKIMMPVMPVRSNKRIKVDQ